MMRVPGAEDITDVMERIMDRGIVVDPCTRLLLTEPEWIRRFHWVVESSKDEPARAWERAA